MEKITVAVGDAFTCPRCTSEVVLVDQETANPAWGHSRIGGRQVYMPTHTYPGGTLSKYNACPTSRRAVTEEFSDGLLRVEFNPGTVAGVAFSEVMSILEDADLEIYNDYGTDRPYLTNREELAERVMKLLASKEGSTTS